MTRVTKTKIACVAVLLSVLSIVISFRATRFPRNEKSAPAQKTPLLGTDSQWQASQASSVQATQQVVAPTDQYRNVPPWTTPLVSAVGHGDLEAVKALVAQGVDVNEKPKGMAGWTPLMTAINNGQRTNVVDYLLEHGADPNVKDFRGMTALMYATLLGDDYTNFVQRLIAAGADVNAKDNEGSTPLQYAKGRPAPAIAEILRRAGAKE
jgi:hypothetical protein